MLKSIGDLLQRTVALAGFTATALGTAWLAYGGYAMVARRKARKQLMSDAERIVDADQMLRDKEEFSDNR